MLKPRRETAISRELVAAERIPYEAHVAAQVIRTTFGDYLQAFRLAGAAFECNDDVELNAWHERLKSL
jgi:type IV secretion system protein VirB4